MVPEAISCGGEAMTEKGAFSFCASERQAEKIHRRGCEDSVRSQKQFPRKEKAITAKGPFCFCTSEWRGTEDIRVRIL